MGKRGPAPKPKMLKIAEGNPGCKSLDYEEPVAVGEIKMPTNMPYHAKRVWKIVIPQLKAWGAGEVDAMSVEMFCRAYAKCRKFANDDTPVGGRQARAWWERFTRLAVELGLTPAARTRMRTEPKKKQAKDKMEELIA